MRKFFVGGRLCDVAFCGTVDFFDIGVGDCIESDMTALAS